MEKIKGSIFKDYPYVRIYLEDLEKIINLLKENNFTDITLKTQNYLLKESELKDLKEEQLSFLEINSYHPHSISITFESGFASKGVRIYCGTKNTLVDGIVKNIEEILRKNNRRIFNFLKNKWIFFSLFIVVSIFSRYISKFLNLKEWIVLIFTIPLILLPFVLELGIFGRNIIILKNKKSQSNFWKRNKDNIILVVISSLITAIVTYILSHK